MGFDNICSTKLSLSLGSDEKNNHQKIETSQKFDLDHDDHLPFLYLTLGLSTELEGTNLETATRQHDRVVKGGESPKASSVSAVSSFSNGSVKREREVSVEDLEDDRESPKVGEDQDEEGPRKKLRLTKEQSLVLEDSFKEHSTLNLKQKQALANMLKLRPRQVEVWFQNRRARTKLKQTEIDSEILKKCCESLRQENERLHKELLDLKASKITAPFYMQLPATTLNMCPSCQRIGGATGQNGSKTSLAMGGAKPHFYSPFANPSRAC